MKNPEDKLRDFSYIRRTEDLPSGKPFELKSVIHLNSESVRLFRDSHLLSGIVHNEYIFTPQRLDKDEHERYKIFDGEPQVNVEFGRFWLTTRSIAIAEKVSTKGFTFRVISRALHTRVRPTGMNVNAIARDYGGHWIGGFTGRSGLMQSGTLYGDSLEREPLIRPEYPRWDKSQVGFTTEYFGPPTKIKVTRDGTIVVYRGLETKMEEFMRFIQSELLAYSV